MIGVEAVICEQRHGESVHAEGHAAGVRRLGAAAVDAPHLTEMLTVVVEAHAGGGPGAGVVGDQQLEFERLLQLAHGHQLPHSAEERVVGDVDRVGQLELGGELPGARDPALAERHDVLR